MENFIFNFKNLLKQLTYKIKNSNGKFLFVVIFITFLMYINILRGEFVTADDIPGIVENPLTKDMLASLKTLNLNTIKNAGVYYFFGMNPSAYHTVSILIHLMNIPLAYILAKLLFNERIAKIAAVIFALHPVNSEAVAWISASPYAINGTFSLITIIFFVLGKKTNAKKFILASIVTYTAMVIHDKGAWALVVPIIIGVIDQFLFSNRINFKSIAIYVLPFILIAGISAYITVGKNYKGRVEALTEQYYFDPTQAPPLLNRIPFTLFEGAVYLIFPYELNIYPGEKTINISEYRFILVGGLLILLAIVYLWKHNRVYAGLILGILAGVGPTFSPIQIAWLMTERYLYLSSVFFAMLLALILQNIHKKHYQNLKMGAVIVIVLWSIRIILRTEDWRTNKNLWLSTLKFSPDSYRVYNNLGDVYMKEKDYDKAIENFSKSFEIFPQYADAMHNLAVVYFVKNDLVNAKKYMQMAVNTKPTLYPAWEKLGIIYLQEKQYEIAELHFKEALKINPNAELALTGLRSIGEERKRQGIQ